MPDISFEKIARSAMTLLLTAACAEAVPAVDVYRWVDESGTVHFSQWRPESGGPGDTVQIVDVDEGPTQGVGGDIYPVEELAAAIRELRTEMADDRADRRARQRAPAPPAVVTHAQPVGYGVWPWVSPHAGRPPSPGPQPPNEPEPEPTPSLPFRPPGD
ncbi:DUF4124 domain-containing protein [Elongatibacter sediminis]|uniref:DUF4124 domain-containing protein n=1 Tax=Elongatibacter sediminis TaxID=3119006 RepID=A0AAW9R5X5_9GAMM